MTISSTRYAAIGVSILLPLAILFGSTGCNKGGGTETSSGGSPATGTSATTQTASSGEAIFKANNCGNCHNLGGTGRGRAPDLSHVGADSTHTADWIAEHIKNPKTHNPQSRMPAFENKMSAQDIQTLAAYLANLK